MSCSLIFYVMNERPPVDITPHERSVIIANMRRPISYVINKAEKSCIAFSFYMYIQFCTSHKISKNHTVMRIFFGQSI